MMSVLLDIAYAWLDPRDIRGMSALAQAVEEPACLPTVAGTRVAFCCAASCGRVHSHRGRHCPFRRARRNLRPMLAPFDPDRIGSGGAWPCRRKFLLGTDEFGRDI